jgi:DNA (cytosine-5)-methyltransferase 1
MKHTPTGHSAFENEIYYPKKTDGSRVKGYNTTYKRMEWDKPAPTVTTYNHTISSFHNVHPGNLDVTTGLYSDARVLTIFELMRVSSLPDDWNVPENASSNVLREVMGEGVPPRLLEHAIIELEKAVDKYD